MLADLPVFGICGWSGAGKTTLIERVVRHLCARGLKVAVAKHDVHGIDVDRPGKDTDRFFQAGADVLLQGPVEDFSRAHGTGDHRLIPTLHALVRRYDLVLVEGHKGTPLPKAWLLGANENTPPPEASSVVATLPRDSNRVGALLTILDDWLPRQWFKAPVFGCVLIGGKSTRFGRPKHLAKTNGKTWLERTVELLREVTQTVAVVGEGEVPKGLVDNVHLPDIHDAAGPMAGLLAAMRWAPHASWLVTSCDLPWLSVDALQWLLAMRAPGVWAALPRLPNSPELEPLLAHYDFRSHHLLEGLAATGDLCPARIASSPKVISPSPPPHLAPAWQNVNTEADLRIHRSAGSRREAR